jgi:ATP-grasp domain-containing protein
MFDALGQVVWFSSKVTDGAPLREVCNLAAVCSLIGSTDQVQLGLAGHCVEDATGHRFDYDRRSFDEMKIEHQWPIVELIRDLASSGPTTLLPFFAYRLTTSLALSTRNVRLLGNPPDLERMFDYKPWVEDQLGRLGVRTVSWHHFRKSEPYDLKIGFPMVIRPPVGTGGDGMFFVADHAALATLLATPYMPEFLSAATYLSDVLPLNVTGCVNTDGSVSQHPVSLQVIGASVCTPRRFGYCGNDFGRAVEALHDNEIRSIERMLDSVGRWMSGFGFRGAFGLDLMIKDGEVIISELNPRFQGSSHLGAELMRDAGFDDVYQQHIRSHLGMTPSGARPGLLEVVRAQRNLSQVFCYNMPWEAPKPAARVAKAPESAGHVVEFVPAPEVTLDSHALLFRYVTHEVVLDQNGRNLLPSVVDQLLRVRGEIAARTLVRMPTDGE